MVKSNPPPVYRVEFQPGAKKCLLAINSSLLDAAQQAGIPLASGCGGVGTCGQCRVIIIEGNVSDPSENEKEILSAGELDRGIRLACQARIQGDVAVRVPVSSLITGQRLQTESDVKITKGDPPVRTVAVHLPKPGREDSRSDLSRLAAGLTGVDQEKIHAGLPGIRQLSTMAREYNWNFTTLLHGNEIIGILPPGAKHAGMAIDLGTTKIAAGLYDLSSGEQLAAGGELNPQIAYGEDIISRMAYVIQHPGGDKTLSHSVREVLDTLLGDLTAQEGISRDQVAEICVVGNTAMIHLFLELPVRPLATSPFAASILSAMDVKAQDAGLTAAPGAYVHILPGIGGFVGADHVAMVLASHLDHSPHISLGIDIGTNTEIFLTHKERNFFQSVSCASGPAFEGVHISCGMRAAPGAIESVKLSSLDPVIKTIDNVPAVGVCGSGLIDITAELLRLHVIDHRGRFDRDHDLVRKGNKEFEFLLVPADLSGTKRDLVITQEDINQIQLAKGAVRAGLDIILESAGIEPTAVKEVIIAGAFGTFLNIQNAVRTGLLPVFPNAIFRQVGNAALAGAAQSLVSKQFRKRARKIAEKTHHLELTTYPDFSLRFAYGMLFPGDES
jgi:uncharacterized 2Fe-2S/4Fe-4S cluster protein (DUF4445 family)